MGLSEQRERAEERKFDAISEISKKKFEEENFLLMKLLSNLEKIRGYNNKFPLLYGTHFFTLDKQIDIELPILHFRYAGNYQSHLYTYHTINLTGRLSVITVSQTYRKSTLISLRNSPFGKSVQFINNFRWSETISFQFEDKKYRHVEYNEPKKVTNFNKLTFLNHDCDKILGFLPIVKKIIDENNKVIKIYTFIDSDMDNYKIVAHK